MFFLINSCGVSQTTGENGGNCFASFVYISGKTNINNFNFEYEFPQNNPFIISRKNVKRNDSAFFKINFPVKDFKTTNILMYDDFMDLLKEPVYPYIIIGIPVKELSMLNNIDSVIVPDINITLAGVTKKYRVRCRKINCNTKFIVITGQQDIELTGFGLVPPQKYFGLIKVENDVVINFGLLFQLN